MKIIGTKVLPDKNKKLPILFLWDNEFRSYIPSSYNQICTGEAFVKNTLSKFECPIEVLWLGRNLFADSEKSDNNPLYINKEDLSNFSSIGCLARIERVEEFSDGNLRLSIGTAERVKIYNISSNIDGTYYGQYELYVDLPMTEQDKEQAMGIIEEIKEKYVILKRLKPEVVGELEFLVALKSQTIEEYASRFSLESINIYKEHNNYYLNELFTMQKALLRLQNILLKLELLTQELA